MVSINDALIIAQEEVRKGNMTTDEANVYIVQLMGVRIVSKLDKATRTALNNAVKNGKLGHLKKDGLKPEAYFNVNGKANAIEKRNKIALESVNSIKSICI